MAEKSEPFERLHELQELSTNKKRRLSKAEQEEVLSVSSALFARDEEGYQAVLNALTDFASDVGTELLAKNWKDLMEAKRPVVTDLKASRFSADLGKRLRISLAGRLLEADSASALRLLLDAFENMRPAKKHIPTLKDLGMIQSALIEPAGQSLSLLPLESESIAKHELNLLTTYVLAAGFLTKEKQKPLPPKTQIEIVRWANKFLKRRQLPPKVAELVAQTMNTWDTCSRSILAREIDTLQIPLREVFAPFCQPQPAEPQSSAPNASPPSVTSVPVPREQSFAPSEPYNVSKEIERLGNYVRSIESRLKESQETIEKIEHDSQKTLNELGVARSEREEARRRAAVAQASVTRLSAEKSGLLDEAESLRTRIEKLAEELEAARVDHETLVADHGAHLDSLSERIAREGEHRVDAFRNKLGAKIQTYADNLIEATGMEMTSELGTVLRNQMSQLLRLLKAEGIRIEGNL